MAKKKCDNCLRKAQATTTGVSPRNATLKIDMGGAVFYVMPGPNGEIEVTLNAENIKLGNYWENLYQAEQRLTKERLERKRRKEAKAEKEGEEWLKR